MPTMGDIADRVGVSRQLVSLVMRNARGPSPATRERVLAAAAELGYRTHAPARLLRQKRTGLIGAFYSMRHPFESHVAEEMLRNAPKRDFRLVLGPVTEWRSTGEAIDELLEQRVEALIGFVSPDWEELVERVGPHIPIVFLGGPSPGIDNVHIDNARGMRLAIDHLRELGHTRIAHLAGDHDLVGDDRARAYEQAMLDSDLMPDVFSAGWSEEDGARAAGRWMTAGPGRPTAVLCASDMIAVGFLAALAQAGVSVPRDLSVVGWDDSYVAALSYHDLTSVRQDTDVTAAAGLDLAVRRLDDPEAEVVSLLTDPRLVVRSTTARLA